MKSYRSGGTPWTVIIGKDGLVYYNDFGISSEGAIRYIESRLKTKL